MKELENKLGVRINLTLKGRKNNTKALRNYFLLLFYLVFFYFLDISEPEFVLKVIQSQLRIE